MRAREAERSGGVVGSARLVAPLGEGGSARVFLAEHPAHGAVALKVLHPALVTNDAAVNRLATESQALNELRHPAVVRCLDVELRSDTPHLVLEALHGAPLGAVIRGPVSERTAFTWLSPLCEALAHVHERGWTHGDVTGKNVFLSMGPSGARVKLIDFGLARRIGEAGTGLGTPAATAPEIWRGQSADARSDLYALGVLAYRLATGRAPFPDGGAEQLAELHCTRTPLRADEANPDISPAWADVIARCLAKNPAHRFDDALALRDAFERALRGERFASLEMQPPPERREATRVPFGGEAAVSSAMGHPLYSARFADLSASGAFIAKRSIRPALLSSIRVEFTLAGEPIECRGLIVRVVTDDEAAAFGTRSGFAVQFTQAPERLAKLLACSMG